MSDPVKPDPSSSRFSQMSTLSSCASDSRFKNSEASGAVPVERRVDLDTKKKLMQTLLAHPVLSYLPSDDMQTLLASLQYFEIGANEFLYEEGTPSRHLYFLETGSVRLKNKGKDDLVSKSGTAFGDQVLVGGLRVESASTIDAMTFWRLNTESVQPFVTKLKSCNFQRARSTLCACGFNYYLSASELSQMALELLPCRFSRGDKVVMHGELGSTLFFLASGEATVHRGGVTLRVLSRGDFFGEQAILYGQGRTATVVALDCLECFIIDQLALLRVLGSSFDQVIYRNSIPLALDASAALQNLSEEAKRRLVSAMKIRQWEDTCIPAGTARGDRLWIVLSGALTNKIGNRWAHYEALGAEELQGDEASFFEQDVLPESPQTIVAEIGREEFLECLGVANCSLDPSKVRIFQGLPAEATKKLLSEAELRSFADGEVLVSEKGVSPYVFVVKRGSVHLSRAGRLLRTLSKFDSCGERSIFLPNSLWATAKAVGEVECWVFSAVSIDIPQLSKFELSQDAHSEDVQMRDLLCVDSLGSGQFGSVFYSVTGKPASYAVKCISKGRIESGNLHRDVLNERDVLMRLNHPMTLKLHRTFKDSDNVYFLMEYVEGRLFFDVLQKLGMCSEMTLKFYMGCLVLIFEHLQERHVIYRDLKPENLMVDSQGFLKLIDFGSAKCVTGRTNTVIGTPQYMAPEMILGRGYDRCVDMWSLGVLMFELLCGGVPFGEGEEDPVLVLQKVLSEPLTFPAFVRTDSPECRLIAQLLQRDPRDRATLGDVKRHEFMSGVAYSSLLERSCSPPFVPRPLDRSKAIRAARANPKDWTQALAEEGMDEELDLPIKRLGATPSPDWDRDF